MAQRPRHLQPYASADAYFGAQLRSWRTRSGLSQADLARQVHVSGDLIGKIEKAQRRAHLSLAADLDHALAAGGELTRCATAVSASTRTRSRTPPPAPEFVPRTEGLTTPRTRPKSLQLLDHAVATLYTGFGEHGPGLPPSTRGQTPAGPMQAIEPWRGPWHDYQASRFTTAAAGAAALIPTLETQVREVTSRTRRRAAYQALAMTYPVAAATATKLGGNDLAWVCADRAHRRAPEHVRHHFLARDLVAAWLHRPVAGCPELQALARDLSPNRRQPNTNETGDPPHWTRTAASDEEGHPRS